MPITPSRQLEHVERERLQLASYNPRTISKQQLAELVASIERYGFVDPVVVRREDNLVVGGHQRLAAYDKVAKKNGWTTVPVLYVEGLTDLDAKRLNLSLNRIGGTWDYEKLADVVTDVLTGVDVAAQDVDLGVAGFSDEEVRELLDVARVAEFGDVEPFEKLKKDERMLSFRVPEKVAQEVEEILRRFGADEYPKRGPALLTALRKAVSVATEERVKVI